MDGWGALSLVAATLVANWVLEFVLRLWRQGERVKRQQEADKILRAHGMQSHVYLSSIGTDPGELRNALDVCDTSKRLVLDAHGNLVGRVLPTMKAHGPSLRLVIDNTKPKT